VSCRETRRLFTRRLDGRLGASERDALEAHLATCLGCRRELARWEAAARLLRARGPTPVPAGLAERAWHAALDPGRSPSLESWFVTTARRAALAGAVAALAVWAGVLAARTRSARPGEVEAAAQDPIEVAVQLWTAGVGGDGE